MNILYVLDDIVVDFVFVFMLLVGCCVCEFDFYVKNGEWNVEIGKEYFGLDVYYSIIGIIGMG